MAELEKKIVQADRGIYDERELLLANVAMNSVTTAFLRRGGGSPLQLAMNASPEEHRLLFTGESDAVVAAVVAFEAARRCDHRLLGRDMRQLASLALAQACCPGVERQSLFPGEQACPEASQHMRPSSIGRLLGEQFTSRSAEVTREAELVAGEWASQQLLFTDNEQARRDAPPGQAWRMWEIAAVGNVPAGE